MGEIANELFEMFKKSKLNNDKDICYAAKYKVKRIFNKKRPFFEKILSESINTGIKYNEHMIEGYYLILASVSKNSVLTIL